MSLHRRLTLLAAGAVAVGIGIAAVLAYVLVRAELRGQIDNSLRDRANAVSFEGGPGPILPHDVTIRLPPRPTGVPEAAFQLIDASGQVLITRAGEEFPVSDDASAVAAGETGPVYEDLGVGDAELRVLTVPVEPGRALQAARSLEEVNSTLSDLILVLALIAAGGIGVAAGFGWIVARGALVPVARATATATEVTQTGDLSKRIEVEGSDELAELATRFNEMLEALDHSHGAQHRLVADASHELRTPLTSLRTNLELIRDQPGLPEPERRRALEEATAEISEMALLIDDIVELARGGGREDGRARALHHDVRLDRVAESVIERTRRRRPAAEIMASLTPTVVTGDAERIARAISNLIDNAIKFSPGEGAVDVALAKGKLTVRDHGPGFEAEDLPHVFERFYRARGARGLPGSGLGLAIVERIAELHGAAVSAANAEGGGAVVTLEFPDWQPPEGGEVVGEGA